MSVPAALMTWPLSTKDPVPWPMEPSLAVHVLSLRTTRRPSWRWTKSAPAIVTVTMSPVQIHVKEHFLERERSRRIRGPRSGDDEGKETQQDWEKPLHLNEPSHRSSFRRLVAFGDQPARFHSSSSEHRSWT